MTRRWRPPAIRHESRSPNSRAVTLLIRPRGSTIVTGPAACSMISMTVRQGVKFSNPIDTPTPVHSTVKHITLVPVRLGDESSAMNWCAAADLCYFSSGRVGGSHELRHFHWIYCGRAGDRHPVHADHDSAPHRGARK